MVLLFDVEKISLVNFSTLQDTDEIFLTTKISRSTVVKHLGAMYVYLRAFMPSFLPLSHTAMPTPYLNTF